MNLALRSTPTLDLHELIGLFNRGHAEYAGFAERSVKDFRWRYLQRPDIGPEGVIVVEDTQRRALGYAVVGTSGTIWEFAIDPDADRQPVADLLIAEAERRLVGLGVDEIVLHAPGDDPGMAAALEGAGYAPRSAIRHYLSFLDLPGVVEQVLLKHREAFPQGLTAVEFIIRNPRAWHPERFDVVFGEVPPGSSRDRSASVSIRTSVEALVGVMVGAESPVRAVATAGIRITPTYRAITGLKVLGALRLRNPFFFTAADVI